MKKRCTCLYLYADGHAVACYEKRDAQAGTVEFAEIYEKLASEKAFLGFKGRIVFYDGDAFLPLLKGARHVTATVPSVESGSEATKALGLAVGSLNILPAKGGELHWTAIPKILSGRYCHNDDQVGYGAVFNPTATRWADRHVAKIYRVGATAGAE